MSYQGLIHGCSWNFRLRRIRPVFRPRGARIPEGVRVAADPPARAPLTEQIPLAHPFTQDPVDPEEDASELERPDRLVDGIQLGSTPRSSASSTSVVARVRAAPGLARLAVAGVPGGDVGHDADLRLPIQRDSGAGTEDDSTAAPAEGRHGASAFSAARARLAVSMRTLATRPRAAGPGNPGKVT